MKDEDPINTVIFEEDRTIMLSSKATYFTNSVKSPHPLPSLIEIQKVKDNGESVMYVALSV